MNTGQVGRLIGPVTEKYYRMADRCLYEDGEMVIELQEFRVIKHTRCGVWVSRIWSGWGNRCNMTRDHFILNGNGKRLAYPTVEQAHASFIRRKEVQISKLNAQMVIAKAALKAALDPSFEANRTFNDETLSEFTTH